MGRSQIILFILTLVFSSAQAFEATGTSESCALDLYAQKLQAQSNMLVEAKRLCGARSWVRQTSSTDFDRYLASCSEKVIGVIAAADFKCWTPF